MNRLYLNVNAWLNQRTKPRPATPLAINPRLPIIQINDDAAEHYWLEDMDFQERRRWHQYWGLPGRDYQQIQMAAAVDWDPDVNEDWGCEEEGGREVVQEVNPMAKAVQGEDSTGELVQGEIVGRGNAAADAINIDQPTAEEMSVQDDSGETFEAATQHDKDTDQDSGYGTATPSDSPKQHASTLALLEGTSLEESSLTEPHNAFHSFPQTNGLSADNTARLQVPVTAQEAFEDDLTPFPPFEATTGSSTTWPDSPAQDRSISDSSPVFRENGLGCLGDDGPSPDPDPASQLANLRPRNMGSVMERGIPTDKTLNDGLVRRGRDASYPNHKWMEAQEA
ncbi:hypothetical protein PRZ48_012448 [Zasmidium cellare]|uniref:Uncharacterized protein n=1 Tax=Zasmidium cellare TaxID=395010 RepID=A0ABR0E5T5_ZASCE|nr:hypothetical protein PRZ48_012448 [Zasmidium cellare]